MCVGMLRTKLHLADDTYEENIIFSYIIQPVL